MENQKKQNKISGVLLVFRNPVRTPLFFLQNMRLVMKKKKKYKMKIEELQNALLEMQIEMHKLKIRNELYIVQLDLLEQKKNVETNS